MKSLLLVICSSLFFSCIPLRIAPTIKTDKVMVAKKFKRKLTKQYAFIFEDPKDANEFYNYVNTKYELNHNNVEWNVPFVIEVNTFFFSFYETEIPDKALNFLPFLIDAKLEQEVMNPMFKDAYVSRKDNWYLAITVDDAKMKDCLKAEYRKREVILKYLRDLRIEYLNTDNYLEALLRKQ